MTGESLAFRRVAVGAPVAEYARLVDRARVNYGGKGTTVAYPTVSAVSTQGVQLTAGTAHVKGDWVQLVASTSFAAETLVITLHEVVAGATANTGMLLDIGIGAAASETVLIPDLLVGQSVASASGVTGVIGGTIIVPIAVAAGTRISARIQGHTASDTLTVGLQYRASGFADTPGVACTAIGVNSSGASTGTVPTAAGSVNTKGDWTELISSTAAPYRYLVVTMQLTSTTVITAADGLVDIGIGAAASEVVIIPDIPYISTGNEQFKFVGCELPFKVSIPAGTRLACRYQATSTGAAARPVIAVCGVT